MLIREKTSFSGALTMHKDEVKECSDKAILQDLLKAGHVEEVKEDTPKGGKQHESKRNNSK
jgi:hypothetical protein